MRECVLLVYLIILAICDWREKRIPLILPAYGLAAALLYRIYLLHCEPAEWEWLLLSALLGIIPGILMLAVAGLTGKVGCGDGVVLLNIGLLTDYKSCILLLCFSMLFMSVFSIGMLSLKRVGKDTRLPYLPFLAVVYAAGMLVGY